MNRPRRWAVAVVALVAVLAVAGAADPTVRRLGADLAALPGTGSFYDPPPVSRTGAPGDVVRSERAAGAPAGTEAWRVLFRSTDLDGRAVLNSGLVVAPTGPTPAGGRTVVSWGHPTTGSAARCAPSRFVDPYLFDEGLVDLVHRGYVVTATDYTGMGTPGPDSYLVGATEGRNVLDAARAARNLLGARVSDRLVLWGHSQGGQAVLFAAQLVTTYAPELDLEAVAVAAPATDLVALLRDDIGDVSGVTIAAYAFSAYASVYGVPPGTILTPAGVSALPAVNALCLLTENRRIHDLTGPLVGRFVTGDPGTTAPWAELLRENSPGGVVLPAPLFVAQGAADQLVRPAATTAWVTDQQRVGNDVTYRLVPGATHGTIANDVMPQLLRWLDSTAPARAAAPAP